MKGSLNRSLQTFYRYRLITELIYGGALRMVYEGYGPSFSDLLRPENSYSISS